MLILVLLLASAVLAAACHPECRVQCDDPVVPAICGPTCLPPACEAVCTGTDPYECSPAKCEVVCPEDQCEADACPQCEVLCNPPVCFPWIRNCSIMCEAVTCSWGCRKPEGKPNVTCEWECDAPACAAPEPPIPPAHSGNETLAFVLAVTLSGALVILIVAWIRSRQKLVE
jgi:hypothetical protein